MTRPPARLHHICVLHQGVEAGSGTEMRGRIECTQPGEGCQARGPWQPPERRIREIDIRRR
jgi:hypothetical protein